MGVSHDPEEGCLVEVISEQRKQQSEQLPDTALCMRLTMRDWEDMRRALPHECCLMPHRNYS